MNTTNVVSVEDIISTSIQDKLYQLFTMLNTYCVNKVEESGILPAASLGNIFSGSPETSAGSTILRSSLNKIRQAAQKLLVKAIPFTKYANVTFFESPSSSARSPSLMSFAFRERPDYMDDSDYTYLNSLGSRYANYNDRQALEGSTIKNAIASNRSSKHSLFRYVRYLNYLFRKHKVPVAASFSFSMSVAPEDTHKLIDMDLKGRKKIRVINVFTVDFNQTRWMPSNIRDGVVKLATATEPELSNEGLWQAMPMGNIRPSSHPDMMQCHDANLFKNIKYGLQIINTLSRKITYGFDAFNYGVEQQG